MTAPIRSMAELFDVPREGELIATVHSFDDFADVFEMLKTRLGLTNEFIDERGGLTKGNTDKCLGRSRQKRLGPMTFDLFTAMMAVEFRVYVDPEKLKAMETVWEQRIRPKYRPDCKPGRISKKILEAAQPIVFREAGKRGREKQLAMQGPQHRSEIARKAAKSRWSKARRKQPVALVR